MGMRGKNWVLLRALRGVMRNPESTNKEIIEASTLYAEVQGVIVPRDRVKKRMKNSPVSPELETDLSRLMAKAEEEGYRPS
jgi:hypothetical protein